MKTFTTTFFLFFCLSFMLTAQLRSTGNNIPSVEITRTDKDITISWTTLKEVNSSYFLVEGSADSIHFITLATITAAGTSSFAKTYQHTDISDNSSKFFRVTLLDMNRNRFSSAVVKVFQPATATDAISSK